MAGFKSVATLILVGILATFSTIAITLDEGTFTLVFIIIKKLKIINKTKN